MNREHWTNDQLIEYIYGVRTENAHLASCAECQFRLHECRASRAALEAEWNVGDSVASDLLAAQRRRFYQVVDKPRQWWSLAVRPQWASAALAIALLAGGATLVEQRYLSPAHAPRPRVANTLSDSQLADDVSSFAESPEPNAAAPLEALFED